MRNSKTLKSSLAIPKENVCSVTDASIEVAVNKVQVPVVVEITCDDVRGIVTGGIRKRVREA